MIGDALDIRANRDKASLEGVNPNSVSVTRMLSDFLSGVVTTYIRKGPKWWAWACGSLPAHVKPSGICFAFTGLIAVFLSAVILVFLLLLFLYESFRVAIAMVATTLPAFTAVFIGLYLTETEVNISSMMGMTMIVGIVTEVGIFFFSEYGTLPCDLDKKAALILAGKNRMRPIAMTTAAAILALLPLAMGIGQGSAMQRPLAVAIISGLVVQLPLVLVVLPAFLKILKTKNPGRGFEAGSPGEKRHSFGNKIPIA